VKEFIGYCSREQLELMFLRFYRGEESAILASSFADSVLKFKKPVSPAQIQGYFMFHKENKEAVLTNVDKIWTLS
jgi:chaperone BCS1